MSVAPHPLPVPPVALPRHGPSRTNVDAPSLRVHRQSASTIPNVLLVAPPITDVVPIFSSFSVSPLTSPAFASPPEAPGIEPIDLVNSVSYDSDSDDRSTWIAPAVTAVGATLPVWWRRGVRVVRTVLRPRKCRTCLGTGYNLCCRCHGRGKQGGLMTQEPLQACCACEGRGHERCERCAATGLANHWLYSPAKDGGWGPRGQ
ncbi:unnamed protein product [Closterium sp. NIES-54]